MAIEKGYGSLEKSPNIDDNAIDLSTYVPEIPDAYYKVESYSKLERANLENLQAHEISESTEWMFTVNVHTNRATRDAGQEPFTYSTMKVKVSDEIDKSDVNAMKTVGYEHLKQLTNSFRTEGIDV